MVGELDELKALGDQFTVLMICPVQRLQDNIDKIINFLSGDGKSGIYITFSKPYKTLEKLLKTGGMNIDKLFFIDCISHSGDDLKKEGMVMYISNTGDLNSLGIGTSQVIETNPGIEFLLIDSLETLLIYNKPETVAIFVQSLIKKSSKFNLKTVMMTPKGDENLTEKIGMFFDKIIEVT